MKIHFISFPVVDQDFVWYSSAVHDVSGSYQSFFSGITVALATGSKPGISTDPVPSELKLDGGGEGESVCVVYVNKEVNAHLWSSTLTPSQQPSAWEVKLGDQHPSLRRREL